MRLREKVPAALAAGLLPVLCVGETEHEREGGETERKLRHQVQEGLESVDDDRLADVVIAYEPIWAIGTGKVATPEIRPRRPCPSSGRSWRTARATRPSACASSTAAASSPTTPPRSWPQPDVDGALVGGASLDPEGFARIVAAAGP